MVSIIIPTFNYGRYLTETLNSVRDQIFQDWECIVVDDGSVDNTHEIVAAFILTDNRYKYIYQNNKGVSSARNLGISTSIGEFVQFLDGDDLLQANKIKSQVGVFTKNPSVDIVYNDVRFFDDENRQQLRRSLNDNKPEDWLPKFSGKGNMVVAHFCKINFLVMNSPLVKKNIFDKVGYFDETMKALEDLDFWMRCALADCYFYFNEAENAFALVRVHQGSLSTKAKLMNNSHFIFLQHILVHKNLLIKYRLLIIAKYVELYWDSVFTKFYFASNSFGLTILSIILLPFFALIKLIRVIK